MNSLAEALGMSLPGSAAIPAPYRDRQEVSYLTGKRIVAMVAEDLKPSDILTANAIHNGIVVSSAIGGSTNAPIHLNAIARHIGLPLSIDNWQAYGHRVPLLVNLQPAGEYLDEDFYRAGAVPTVAGELMRHGLLHEGAMTVNGRTIGDNCRDAPIEDARVIRTFADPLVADAGFIVLRGNLFASAIMKTSVISPEFRARYLCDPADPEAFEGPAVVFDGPEDYHRRIDDPALGITDRTLLFMRGAGPIGYPGAAEVVNMRPPAYLIREGIDALPCLGDGRQSGTSASPSILNASPEAAAMGGLALLRTGDRVRLDLVRGRVDVMVGTDELDRRCAADGGYPYPPSQTPRQELQRECVGQHETGAILEGSEKYQRIAQTMGVPRDNHYRARTRARHLLWRDVPPRSDRLLGLETTEDLPHLHPEPIAGNAVFGRPTAMILLDRLMDCADRIDILVEDEIAQHVAKRFEAVGNVEVERNLEKLMRFRNRMRRDGVDHDQRGANGFAAGKPNLPRVSAPVERRADLMVGQFGRRQLGRIAAGHRRDRAGGDIARDPVPADRVGSQVVGVRGVASLFQRRQLGAVEKMEVRQIEEILDQQHVVSGVQLVALDLPPALVWVELRIGDGGRVGGGGIAEPRPQPGSDLGARIAADAEFRLHRQGRGPDARTDFS